MCDHCSSSLPKRRAHDHLIQRSLDQLLLLGEEAQPEVVVVAQLQLPPVVVVVTAPNVLRYTRTF